MTWSELARAGNPMLGYFARDAIVEIRRVSVGKTIAYTAATFVGAMLVESIGLLQHARLPESGPTHPRDKPPRLRGDLVLDAVHEPDPPSTWDAAPCDAVSGGLR
jgi:hypothetical protein